MARNKRSFLMLVGLLVGLAYLVVPYGCAPGKPEMVKTVQIPDNEIDPDIWGKAYPEEFESWKKTEQPEPATGEAAAAIRRRLRDSSQRFNLRWTEQGESLILGGPWTTAPATATAPDPAPRRAPAQPG